MNNRLRDFSRKAQHLLLLVTGTFPIAVLLLINGFPQGCLSMSVLFAGSCLLLALICLLVPGKFRIAIGIIGTVLLFLLAFWLLPVRENLVLLFLPAGYSTMLLLTLPMGGWHRDEELSPIWYVGCAVLHLLSHLSLWFLHNAGDIVYEPPLSRMLLVSFLVFLLLTMLGLNRASLMRASQYRVQIPLQMRRQNLLLTIGFFLLTVLIAAIPAIGAFLRRLWDSFIALMIRIVHWFSSLFSGGESGGGGGGSADMAVGMAALETTEPTLFQIIVEKMLFALAFIAGIALLIWMGYELWSKLKRLLIWFWKRVTLFGNAALKDYEDEITDTRNDAQYEKIRPLHRLRQRLSAVDENKLPPAQRVRYRYLRLRLKHEEWDPASTVRDTLPIEAAQLYERARYSNQTLTEEDAKRFRQEIRQI